MRIREQSSHRSIHLLILMPVSSLRRELRQEVVVEGLCHLLRTHRFFPSWLEDLSNHPQTHTATEHTIHHDPDPTRIEVRSSLPDVTFNGLLPLLPYFPLHPLFHRF